MFDDYGKNNFYPANIEEVRVDKGIFKAEEEYDSLNLYIINRELVTISPDMIK
jgi:hypothetical protein